MMKIFTDSPGYIEKAGEMCYSTLTFLGEEAKTMKKVLAVVLAACLCLSMAGCGLVDGFRYMKATNLYKDGNYAEALVIFTELGDYADSSAMAQRCTQFVNYAKAEEYFAAGDYASALPLYQQLMLYEDSPVKAARCMYALGWECMESGDYQQAAAWYEELGGYESAPEKCREARWMWLWTSLTQNGPTEYPITEDGSEQLIISAAPEGKLQLTYHAEGNLLGIPYDYEVSLYVVLDNTTADYEVSCKSYAASAIWERANGTVELGAFSGKSYMPIDSFTQTVTLAEDPDVPVSQHEDPSQALLIHSTMVTAQLAVEQYLPALLEATGVEITVKDLGFLSLA